MFGLLVPVLKWPLLARSGRSESTPEEESMKYAAFAFLAAVALIVEIVPARADPFLVLAYHADAERSASKVSSSHARTRLAFTRRPSGSLRSASRTK
jgi:hypothetical protein